MPVIRKDPRIATFDEPLDMLVACHEKIEAQLAMLERLVDYLPGHGADAVAREAAQAVMRYFDTAGGMHSRDEDEDLFPLLRELAAGRGRPEVSAAIEELEREHHSMEAQWSGLRRGLAEVVQGRAALDAAGVEKYCWVYRRHMEREHGAVIPFAREALDEAQRAALGGRMAARRKA